VLAGWKVIDNIRMMNRMRQEGLVAHTGNMRNFYKLPARKTDSKKQLGIHYRRLISQWNLNK
jgi:hypothetical protein